jgi:transcription initiation factor IIE alpha subunit
MGERACYRDYCPECDAQVTIVDGECPECGADLREEEWA